MSLFPGIVIQMCVQPTDYGDAEEVVDESSLWISEMLHLEDALDVVDLVTPCPSICMLDL